MVWGNDGWRKWLILWKPMYYPHITHSFLPSSIWNRGLNWVKDSVQPKPQDWDFSNDSFPSLKHKKTKMSQRSRWMHSTVALLFLLHAFTIIESELQNPWTLVFHLTPRPYWQAGCLLQKAFSWLYIQGWQAFFKELWGLQKSQKCWEVTRRFLNY